MSKEEIFKAALGLIQFTPEKLTPNIQVNRQRDSTSHWFAESWIRHIMAMHNSKGNAEWRRTLELKRWAQRWTMNFKQAKEIARSFLAKNIIIDLYENPDPSMRYYMTNPGGLVFSFSLFRIPSLGSSPYVVVSERTGQVRFIGEHGE